jgi:hypothetical protein
MKRSEATFEAVPRISMDPEVHYALDVSEKTVTLRLLTDRRITHYERLGWYRAQRRATWQQNGNRLVYSA